MGSPLPLMATLWVSHGLPGGSVSRRSPDGAWRSYPDRTTAVATDYAQLVATINANPLWTVNGEEVWVGYWVYNGEQWIDRRPPPSATTQTPEPLVVAADSTGTVWVLDKADDCDCARLGWRNMDRNSSQLGRLRVLRHWPLLRTTPFGLAA